MSGSLLCNDLRALIKKTLSPLNLYSLDAEELLLATCANESNFGTYRTQTGKGPARGIFQMEGNTFNDIWANYLKYHVSLATQLRSLNDTFIGTADSLINNDPYAIAMCRVHYLRSSGNLPDSTDLNAIWNYYKIHYNTIKGAATKTVFVNKYNRYVKQSPSPK